MIISIKDINTGKTVEQRCGRPAIKRIDDNSGLLGIKSIARQIFYKTSEHQDFVYWVASTKGKAIHKGSF